MIFFVQVKKFLVKAGRFFGQAKNYAWLFALIPTVAGALWQWSTTNDLERRKNESALIQKALEEQDKRGAAENIKFVLDLKLVTANEYPKLREYVEHPDRIPGFAGAAIRDHLVTVKKVKGILNKLGKYKGDIDDIDDPAYRRAIAGFQVDENLD